MGEQAVQGNAMSTDSRIFKRLREQQRLIDLQQSEIDQIRYEKELLQEETRKLRQMTHQRGVEEPRDRVPRAVSGEFPNLHRVLDGMPLGESFIGTHTRGSSD